MAASKKTQIRAPSGLPGSSRTRLRYVDMILSSSPGRLLLKRCNDLRLPSFRASAMGPIDLRAHSRNCPAIAAMKGKTHWRACRKGVEMN